MLNKSPLVSVVIPTYNQRPDFLVAAVLSVLEQAVEDFELIVSDNHSEIPVASVLSHIADERVRLVMPPSHLPMVPHFAFAAEQAMGQFISFLASDDYVYPDWLSSMLPEMIRNPNASFGFGEIENVNHENMEDIRYLYREDALPGGIYKPHQLIKIISRFDKTAGWMVGDLIRAAAYKQCGGILRDNLEFCADYALALRLMEVGDVLYVNKRIAKNRSWSLSEGKVGESRLGSAVSDTIKLYNILEASNISLYSGFSDQLARGRRIKARLFSLQLLEEASKGGLTQEAILSTSNAISRIATAPEIEVLLALARSSFVAAFNVVRPMALFLARTRFGRRILG
jgi:glycosyltransferase involved in cell wall biosynthesis